MLLFLVMLLFVAVAAENSHSSTLFDLETEMSKDMFTERSDESSYSNSEETNFGTNFGNSVDNHVTSTEFDSEMSTEMYKERNVGGSNSTSDNPSFMNSTESNVRSTEFVSMMTTGMTMKHKIKRFYFIMDKAFVEPDFDNSAERNVTFQLGESAYLRCSVRNLGDKKVAWVRPDEDLILSIGERVIASDTRMSLLHLNNSDDWFLKIQSTTEKDAGAYMCQINTIPIRSFSIVLNIVVPKATILEGSNLYIQSGTDIDLTCVTNGGTLPLKNVAWFKGELNMDRYTFSSTVYTHKKGFSHASHLKIFRAQSSNSGNYTCKPFNADPVSISVHVFNGRIPKATTVEPLTTRVTVHHGQQPSSAFRFMPFPLLLLLLSILWLLQM